MTSDAQSESSRRHLRNLACIDQLTKTVPILRTLSFLKTSWGLEQQLTDPGIASYWNKSATSSIQFHLYKSSNSFFTDHHIRFMQIGYIGWKAYIHVHISTYLINKHTIHYHTTVYQFAMQLRALMETEPEGEDFFDRCHLGGSGSTEHGRFTDNWGWSAEPLDEHQTNIEV